MASNVNQQTKSDSSSSSETQSSFILSTTQTATKYSLTSTAKSIITASSVIFASYMTPPSYATALRSDEFDVEIRTDFLGLILSEVKVDDSILVTVQSIREDADSMLKQVIRPGMILIAIGDNVVEGYSGKEVVNLFKSISKPTQLTFRDPNLFFDKLNTTKVGVSGGNIVDTTVNFALNETLRVQRLNVSFDN
jgi:hypothetical protein